MRILIAMVPLGMLLANAATVRFPHLEVEKAGQDPVLIRQSDLKGLLGMMVRNSDAPEDPASLQNVISRISPDEAIGFPKQIVLALDIGELDEPPRKGLVAELQDMSCLTLSCLQSQLMPKQEQADFVSSASKAREIHLNSLHEPGFAGTAELINEFIGRSLLSTNTEGVAVNVGESVTRIPADTCTSMLMTDVKAIATLDAPSARLISLAPIFGLQCMYNNEASAEQIQAATYLTREVIDAFIGKQSRSKGSDFFSLVVTLPKAGQAAHCADSMSIDEILGATPAEARRLQKAQPRNSSSADPRVTYQIRLWTIIVLVLALLVAILITMNMQNKKDPLLYTKLQATR